MPVRLSTAVSSLVIASSAAWPQATTPQGSAQNSLNRSEPAPGQSVTVTGRREGIQTATDRISYAVGNDLQGATGTLADVLRNIPSVDVDPLGNLSLRGDSSVVILIDGQPAGALRGAGRSSALQSLPAGRFARVEVMTNPSAAYGPEGSGGIINLITRRSVRPGVSGTMRMNAGGSGRANAGVAISRTAGTTTLSGDLTLRRDELEGRVDRLRVRPNVADGDFTQTRQRGFSETETVSTNWRLALDQKLTVDTQLQLEASGSGVWTQSDTDDRFVTDTGRSQGTVLTRRQGAQEGKAVSLDLRGRLNRTFSGQDHRASLSLSRQRNRTRRSVDVVLNPDTGDGGILERFDANSLQEDQGLQLSYFRPLGDKSKLQLGLDFDGQKLRIDQSGKRGPDPAGLQILPLLTDSYRYRQDVTAVYGTSESSVGKLSVLGGLRLEEVSLALNGQASRRKVRQRYARLYPTLHVGYDIASKQKITASYSRRIQRPTAADLNPNIDYRDTFNLRVGNPDLRPQLTDSFELAWQRRDGAKFMQVAGFYRATRNAITDIVDDVGEGVLLSRRVNLGSSRLTGLELVINHKLTKTLTANANATAARSTIRPGIVGYDAQRSAWQVGGRVSLNWQPSKQDTLQLTGILTGKSLRPQGYRAPTTLINIGYRRSLDPSLALIVTVRDLLGNFGEEVVYRDPRISDRAKRRFGGRVLFVGLSKSFGSGSGNRRDQNFNFEAGRTE